MPLTRPDLDTIPRYVAGKNPSDVARESGVAEAVKLASNEVPYGPLPGVVEAVADAVSNTHRYPDPAVVALRNRLGERYDVAPDRIVSGCGSVALAEHIVRAAVLPGDEVVYSWRSFEAYPIITTSCGATSVQVPNTGAHAHDLDAMADAVTERTKVAFVCTPNNPTGTAVHADDLERFLDRVGPDVLVVIDEAYREFVRDPEVPDGLAAAKGRPNVVVLRTLSKAWGLAGIRVGWLAADPSVADAIRKVVTPFSVNHVAQAAALAALDAEDEMNRRVDLVVDERTRVVNAVRELRTDVPDTQANFLWLPLGDDAAEFAAGCEKRGVIVRPFAGDGVRVTIGTPAENDLFLRAAGDLL
ncbi:histidinol-phosphate transaminase [Cryptosporangium phraense]|uniref:Aromatic amino acid aminotransferase n=1 Tax=Cryptosporangium phraense TaxID=2593070 RepID=A0A545AFF6_9ACTN|nr:histidinol-phosphate transaminase [Cryptosporangium phraense]TQS40068.1 histidinol-phosphate transaminase [Cryptosporangium phraense]